MNKLPLEGIRVIDFSWIIAGPTCTRMLGMMGAEIIKIERLENSKPETKVEFKEILAYGNEKNQKNKDHVQHRSEINLTRFFLIFLLH